MDGRKFTATLVALVVGIVLSAGSASAQTLGKPPFQGTAGYLQGDPAPGKLIPYYMASDTITTIIGIENTIGNDGPFGAELDIPVPPTTVHITGGDILVHFHIYNKSSVEFLNFTKCYSPFDFGYLVLQKGSVSSAQSDDLNFPTGPNATRRNKSQVAVVSVPEGYVGIRAERVFGTANGTCGSEDPFTISADIPDSYSLLPVSVWGGPLSLPLATWAILIDVSSGFFATEIPTATARIDLGSPARVSGGIGAFGLIPQGNEVITRYDANPFNQSISYIFTWFTSNNNSTNGFLDCEDEDEISTGLPFPSEAGFFVISGVSDPPTSSTVKDALRVCTDVNQYRGVVRFTMPDTGFIWTHITQQGAHFRENYLGYNLQNNWFIDCADGALNFGRPVNQFTKGLDCQP